MATSVNRIQRHFLMRALSGLVLPCSTLAFAEPRSASLNALRQTSLAFPDSLLLSPSVSWEAHYSRSLDLSYRRLLIVKGQEGGHTTPWREWDFNRRLKRNVLNDVARDLISLIL